MPHPPWLALMIGNSRLHWAAFEGETLCQRWDAAHLPAEQVARLLLELEQGSFSPTDFWSQPGAIQPIALPAACPLWLASVVPAQTALWRSYRAVQPIVLADVGLADAGLADIGLADTRLTDVRLTGLYPTLGVDRALALLGAASVYGLPSLVMDAGTGLTLTGADACGRLVGGAILPGLGLQLRSLSTDTASLPELTQAVPRLPQRWATHTAGAIWSGVLYTLLAGLRDFVADWQQQFAASSILFTGGDAVLLQSLLTQQEPKLAEQITIDPDLIFWGMRQVRSARGTDVSSPVV